MIVGWGIITCTEPVQQSITNKMQIRLQLWLALGIKIYTTRLTNRNTSFVLCSCASQQ